MRHKFVIATLLLLAIAAIPMHAGAADVFIKKKPSGEQEETVAVPKSGPQSKAPTGDVPMGSMPGLPEGTPPCTEQDAKLITQIDKKILARSDSIDPEDTMDDAREWQNNLKSKEGIENLINLYFRCSFVIMQQRAAMGIKPSERPKQP